MTETSPIHTKINRPDERGSYAILEACKIGKNEIFKELLNVRSVGVDLNLRVRDRIGQTIFHRLCSPSGERKSLLDILRRIYDGTLRLDSELPDLYLQDAHGQMAIDCGHYCDYCNRTVDKNNYARLCLIFTVIDPKSAWKYDIWNRKRHICHFYSKSGEDKENEQQDDNKEEEEEEICCPICFDEDFPCNFITNCGHRFHFHCLNTWCAKDRYDRPNRTTCPLCRTQLDENCLDSFFSLAISTLKK